MNTKRISRSEWTFSVGGFAPVSISPGGVLEHIASFLMSEFALTRQFLTLISAQRFLSGRTWRFSAEDDIGFSQVSTISGFWCGDLEARVLRPEARR